MYLSHLLVNVGDNPDRLRPGRAWLRNRYRVHQRLCMAFPSAERLKTDTEFLKPYNPDDFAQGHVHVKRNPESGFLFRIDPLLGNRVAILVLSALEPDWDYAFQNARYLLAAPSSEPKPLRVKTNIGTQFRFLVEVNPTKKTATLPKEDRMNKVEGRHGKRVAVLPDEFESWFDMRSKQGGFRVERMDNIHAGYAYFNKTGKKGEGQKLRSVRYEGLLEVTDPDVFRKTLISGIGPAKAFGFGLLSVTRV